jgi:hypothetical protein
MRFFGRAAGFCTSTVPARSTAFLHVVLRLSAYDRVRVAAKSNSTAARSSMSVRVKLIDRTLFVVLHIGDQEITRQLASIGVLLARRRRSRRPANVIALI